jgi:hypothetical protein
MRIVSFFILLLFLCSCSHSNKKQTASEIIKKNPGLKSVDLYWKSMALNAIENLKSLDGEGFSKKKKLCIKGFFMGLSLHANPDLMTEVKSRSSKGNVTYQLAIPVLSEREEVIGEITVIFFYDRNGNYLKMNFYNLPQDTLVDVNARGRFSEADDYIVITHRSCNYGFHTADPLKSGFMDLDKKAPNPKGKKI